VKTFLAGLILGVILVPLVVYLYFASGMAPVATASGSMPFENALASAALDARIKKEMPKSVPIAANEQTYIAGAETYKNDCAVCHGLPLQPQGTISKGMFPKPPQLFQGKGVTDDEPGETYWKVDNGIRLTGMPSFANSLSTTEMWQVSLLLANADKLPDSAKQALVTSGSPAPSEPAQTPSAQPSTPQQPAPGTK
jgi:mono/diheme cytochrome c family protein